MIPLSTTLSYYKRQDIQEELLRNAADREIAVKYGDNGFGKRPEVLSYPSEILEFAKRGATSFHASEERWHNAFELKPSMRKAEQDELRKGWDLVIDIDCPHFPYSKIAADLIVKALKHHNISAISIKFSGNKGFHIGVPFEAFPSMISKEPTSSKFPDATKQVAIYLKRMIENIFAKEIIKMEKGDIQKIAENLHMEIKDMMTDDAIRKIDADKVLNIDTILISSRHLYRMPYSLHEKSGLASIPVPLDRVLAFERDEANPLLVKVSKHRFLDRETAKPNEANELFDKAVAANIIKTAAAESENKGERVLDIPEQAIPEEFFPPAIKNILKGLKDGKKRALFVLVNFLTSVGWSYETIEQRLQEWNKLNEEPLRETVLVGSVRYHKQNKKKALPPNYDNKGYYYELGILSEEEKNSNLKNPVAWAKKMLWLSTQNQKKPRKKKEKVPKKESQDNTPAPQENDVQKSHEP